MSSCSSFHSSKKVSSVSSRDFSLTSHSHGANQYSYQAQTSKVQRALKVLLNSGIQPDLILKLQESLNQSDMDLALESFTDDSDFPDSDMTSIYPVDQTVETSSKASRSMTSIASSSRSRCAGETSKYLWVVPAVVKPAKEFSDQSSAFQQSPSDSATSGTKESNPLVSRFSIPDDKNVDAQRSAPAVSAKCDDQPSVFKPAAVKPVVDPCSILKPADAEIPDGLNVGAFCCSNAVVAKEAESPEFSSPSSESIVPVLSLYCVNQTVVAGSSGLPWCTNKIPSQNMSFVLTKYKSTIPAHTNAF